MSLIKTGSLLLIAATLTGLAYLHFADSGSPSDVLEQPINQGSRLSRLLGGQSEDGYLTATAAREFSFPADHGPHPGFRNEWWYLTGNLDSESGRRFGYELTFFRFSLAPPTMSTAREQKSKWRTNQVFIAHFAVSDPLQENFDVEQRVSRGALGLAGAQTSPFRVWVEDWSIQENSQSVSPDSPKSPERWQLSASGEDLALSLNLESMKSPVLNGIHGLSQKSSKQGNASYYYSIPRLRSTGSLLLAGEKYKVSGLSWLDREWSSSALASDQQGWDWFALQLSDGSDLMFYSLRKNDGIQDSHSAGTWIETDGVSRHLSRNEVSLTVTEQWQNPAGDAYPARWEIRVDSLDLLLDVTPIMENQELVTTVRYWEGAVDVEGRRGDDLITGRGYVELTGYSE